MSKPVVAIVGRANVGKSTLFNYLAGERLAIVDNMPGVTRDRLYSDAHWQEHEFSLIDTGGIEPHSNDQIRLFVREQAKIAIDTADVIIFLVDLQSGLTADDEEIAQLLRQSGKPVLLAVNKVDQVGDLPAGVYEFYNLGLGQVFPVSAAHRLGVGELLDALVEEFPPPQQDEQDKERIKVAVIGKPNAGKSSLVNYMLGEERLIVTDIPGTTRDAIDSLLDNDYGSYTFIDTAGMRKKSRIDSSVEKYSTIRSLAAVERADVCLIMIDAAEGVTEQDTKVAGHAHNQGKASILVVNKWDLVEKEGNVQTRWQNQLRTAFSFMPYAPILMISAKTGQRVDDLFGLINQINEQAGRRVSTGVLNDLVNEAVAMTPPPQDKGRQLRIYYATQVGVKPPQFALFINDRKLMHFSYERYLENQLRRSFGFTGTPVWLLLRPKNNE